MTSLSFQFPSENEKEAPWRKRFSSEGPRQDVVNNAPNNMGFDFHFYKP